MPKLSEKAFSVEEMQKFAQIVWLASQHEDSPHYVFIDWVFPSDDEVDFNLAKMEKRSRALLTEKIFYAFFDLAMVDKSGKAAEAFVLLVNQLYEMDCQRLSYKLDEIVQEADWISNLFTVSIETA